MTHPTTNMIRPDGQRRVATLTIQLYQDQLPVLADLRASDGTSRRPTQEEARKSNEIRNQTNAHQRMNTHALLDTLVEAVRAIAPEARLITTDIWRGRRKD